MANSSRRPALSFSRQFDRFSYDGHAAAGRATCCTPHRTRTDAVFDSLILSEVSLLDLTPSALFLHSFSLTHLRPAITHLPPFTPAR